jgi:hypothetical protein
MTNHSLRDAVDAGVITDEKAFCGLVQRDLAELEREGFSRLAVLIRFRGDAGDGRGCFSVYDANTDHFEFKTDDGRVWSAKDIRDITAVPAPGTDGRIEEPPAFYTCPVDAAHTRFYARFAESVCAFIDANGDRGEDVKNTYDSDGQLSPTWCWDCSSVGVTTEAKASEVPA